MDRTTERLSAFVCALNYNDLTPKTVHQVKRVLVDTLACALGGYLSEPAKIARQLASTVKSKDPRRKRRGFKRNMPIMLGESVPQTP